MQDEKKERNLAKVNQELQMALQEMKNDLEHESTKLREVERKHFIINFHNFLVELLIFTIFDTCLSRICHTPFYRSLDHYHDHEIKGSEVISCVFSF